LLYRLSRFPDRPGKGQPRDRALGFVEPSVFSRYATAASTPVILSFASAEALERLKQGKEMVILAKERKYPEEDNSYNVLHLGGVISITARAPGLEVGEKSDMPVQGFENGFTRWTFESTEKMNPAGEVEIRSTYTRFMPVKGRLVKIREVTSELTLKPSAKTTAPELPEIVEPELTVLDYSGRMRLFPQNRGIVDQSVNYKLKNRKWDIDRSWVESKFNERFDTLVKRVIPEDLAPDRPKQTSTKQQADRSRTVVYGLIIFSAICGLLLFKMRNNRPR